MHPIPVSPTTSLPVPLLWYSSSPKLRLQVPVRPLRFVAAGSAAVHLPGREESLESVSCWLRALWRELNWTSIPGPRCGATARAETATFPHGWRGQ